MSKSGDGRFLGHSKSWPSDRDSDIDRALSVGFDKSRGSLLRIWPPLKDEFNDLRKLYEDLQKANEDLHKANEDLQKEYKDLKKGKEVLEKKIEVLQKEDLKDEFSDLRKLYEDLLKGKEDLEKKNEDLEMKNEDLETKNKDLQKENEGLQKENKDLKSVSGQADFESKAELREMLSKFKLRDHPEVNVDLMKKAHNMYRSEFPWDFSGKNPTFTGTIAALVKEQANEDKLGRLRDVARAFRPSSLHWWNAEMGEQFFILCKSVAQWNNEDFHPSIEGVERCLCMNKARNGVYTVDGVDLKPIVVQLLHT